ncbi:hypothetical protein MMC31_004775 [Peltigera leucophlebia]|nr:hypothetical protein [Peltigera leucophlebia]
MASSTRSSQTGQSNFKDFLVPSFSPVEYLNATLPYSAPSASNKNIPLSLSATVSQTQTHISSLTAQSSRLSATLTSLTDDILRISPRLTYEVELLRGEVLSLCESFSQTGELHSAISCFISQETEDSANSSVKPEPGTSSGPNDVKLSGHDVGSSHVPSKTRPADGSEPPMADLRTLLRVRALLTQVTQIFSLALSWPMPPSLLSPSSALVAISAPVDPVLEEKGQAACSQIRQEILALLQEGDRLEEGKDGVERAVERVRGLRECLGLWKGTGEEKARKKFVDGLEKMVEERTRMQFGAADENITSAQANEETKADVKQIPSRGPGLLRNLQRLREEIYME